MMMIYLHQIESASTLEFGTDRQTYGRLTPFHNTAKGRSSGAELPIPQPSADAARPRTLVGQCVVFFTFHAAFALEGCDWV